MKFMFEKWLTTYILVLHLIVKLIKGKKYCLTKITLYNVKSKYRSSYLYDK